MDNAKPFCIPKRWVWKAYKRVKANRGAAGVDEQSVEQFEEHLKGNLYKLWNRLSSGSYFPPPVKRVDIAKRDGGTRPWGIPTVADRIAQAVVKAYLEPALEQHFHPDSYGYRPKKSALDAVGVARKRCWRSAWVLDLDIRAYFDTIPHGLLLKAGLCCNFRAATSGWTTFGKHRTGSPIMPSDNPFKWRQFEPALILQGVRWYLRYALSYRDLADMMRERGLCVDHTTIYRWVQRYAPEIDKRCRPFLRRTNDSYRIDETYVRVAGAWTYLYRGVDSNGDTLDFLLRATRDRKAAIAFFRKTLGAAHTTPPRVGTVDKNPAYPVAFEAVRHEGLVRPRSNLRQCKYLNNIIEQDHRFIKRRTRPMLGFKRFTTAWRTLRGIEIMHALRKGQARWMAKGDVVGQTQLIHKVFGLAA